MVDTLVTPQVSSKVLGHNQTVLQHHSVRPCHRMRGPVDAPIPTTIDAALSSLGPRADRSQFLTLAMLSCVCAAELESGSGRRTLAFIEYACTEAAPVFLSIVDGASIEVHG